MKVLGRQPWVNAPPHPQAPTGRHIRFVHLARNRDDVLAFPVSVRYAPASGQLPVRRQGGRDGAGVWY
jgi:hypothetical protein